MRANWEGVFENDTLVVTPHLVRLFTFAVKIVATTLTLSWVFWLVLNMSSGIAVSIII